MPASKIATPDHPVLQPIAERWSPYALDPKPISDADLLTILEAARWAASAFNEQPWRFIVAKRENEADFATALSCLVEANQAWAKNAAVLILTAVRDTFTRNDNPNRVAEHDLGLSASQLVLQTAALGLHAHQMAGVDLEKTAATYNIPEPFRPLTAIAIGHAADPDSYENQDLAKRDQGTRSRKSLGEIAFTGNWETAAPFTT